MVALVGVSLLGPAMYVNLAPKAAAGFAVEDAFVKFVTRTVGLGVFEQSVIVNVLFAAGQVEAVECGFAAFAGQEGVDIVARQTPAQGNGGRGELVNSNALVDALNSGHLGGAGLDVFDQEPLPFDHPILSCDQVVLTPHIADQTPEGIESLNEGIVNNVIAFLEGHPQNVVTKAW